ncbi:shikimate kinase [Fretibacter rubidus]|uniref:shikimate kinase n=1 Tax=Fretibacter rubidus TaxID=570162 RepID=UPI00352B9551
MQLTRAEFDEHYAAGKLKIAFIGMSNIGKSYTASRLSKSHDFQLVEVDQLIWEELGEQSMADFARWQGQPYSSGYREREAKSIALETKATRKALSQTDGNQLLDTTGSVIYVEDDVLRSLKNQWLIVHIKAEDRDMARLKSDYFNQPKPLVWRDKFIRDTSMSEQDNIRACYDGLLQSRKAAYAALADITLTSSFILDADTSMDAIFDAMRAPLI